MSAKDEGTVCRDQWYRYVYCRDRGHGDFVRKSDTCEDFFAGLQWCESDLAKLREVKRPALTINKILSTMETIMGEQIENRSEVSFQPKSGSPAETAEALNRVWMHIAQQNQLSWVRSDVFADGLIRSRGFYDVRLDFDDNVFGEVRIDKLNPKNVVVDPDAEDYDPDRWEDVFVSKWYSPNALAVLYGKDKAALLEDRTGSSYVWGFDSVELQRERFSGRGPDPRGGQSDSDHSVSRHIRVLDRQHHVLDKTEHFVDPRTGDLRPIPDGWDRDRIALALERYGLLTTEKLVQRLRWTVTADDVLLHDAWSPYKHFTVVPYFPHFRYGRTIGKVENLLGPQELLNKSVSQELHVINTTANSGWKIKSGALMNMTVEELEARGAQTGLVLELDNPASAEKITPNQVPSGLDRLSYKAEEYIKGVSSVSDSMQGFDREDVAAKAIAAKQQRGAVTLIKPLDNLQRTDWLLARAVLDMVQCYYTEERTLRITRNSYTGEAEEFTVNQVGAEGRIANDLTVGEYDIVITSVPARATLEDSQFEQAVSLRELGVPIPDSVLIENSRLQRKAEIVKQIEGDKDSPQAQAQAQLAQRGAEAEVAEKEAQARQKQADAQLKQAKAQKEAASAGQEQDSLQAEREKAAGQLQLQAAKDQGQLELAREKHQQELAMERERHTQDLELDRQARELQMAQQAAQTALASESDTLSQEIY
jgi:hypothetical protein